MNAIQHALGFGVHGLVVDASVIAATILAIALGGWVLLAGRSNSR